MNFIKIKNFCSVKDTIKGMKRQVKDWENVFANHICDKERASRIYKKILKTQQ